MRAPESQLRNMMAYLKERGYNVLNIIIDVMTRITKTIETRDFETLMGFISDLAFVSNDVVNADVLPRVHITLLKMALEHIEQQQREKMTQSDGGV